MDEAGEILTIIFKLQVSVVAVGTYILMIYCCVRNPLKTQGRKTTTVFYSSVSQDVGWAWLGVFLCFKGSQRGR